MSYLDRLRKGKYTSPSGKEFDFFFTELSRSGSKKSATLEVPQSDFAVVQDHGCKAIDFPLSIFFDGADYDQIADEFYAALREHGPGVLAHPRWGDVKVLATSFTQSEKFVDGMGRAEFSVDFVHAPNENMLSTTAITASAVASAASASIESANAVVGAKFGNPVLRDLAECRSRLLKSIRSTKTRLIQLTGTVREVAQKINAASVSFEANIDTLINSPGELASAFAEVISAAAGTEIGISEKVSAFGDLLTSAITENPTTASQAIITEMIVSTVLAASVESASTGSIYSRDDAIGIHNQIADIFERSRLVIEAAEKSSGYAADPETQALLAKAATNALAYLLASSYDLRMERRVSLDGAATPLELVYRFYKDVDRLDEFCDQNHLEGDLLFIVPAGQEVRYYAE